MSEYGINTVIHPVHINRELHKAGLLAIREERGLELLDASASKAFAVADHQVAHVYINDPSTTGQVYELLKKIKGVALVLDKEAQKNHHIDHKRSGDFVVIADEKSWFTYYFWMDDKKAPDYARVVDIHKNRVMIR
ncbi:MAG: phosphodiesterase [Flavisolibacter sp.]|nr:phosphodiesterase [Flavisolibacter sp.]